MFKSMVLKRFMKRKGSIIGAIVLIIFFSIAIFGPMLCSQDPLEQNLDKIHASPDKEHLLGTDNLGRDIFTRMVYGARISLSISFIGVITGVTIGIILGVLAGYYGGWVDAIISRFLEILLAFPGLLLGIIVVAVLGNGLANTTVAIAIISIPSIARMVRGVVISLKNLEYINVCHVMGASGLRIMFTHIIPNSMSQIIINVTLNLGTAILMASSLSFLGLGVQPPNPEWGAILSNARGVVRSYPMGVFAPGIAITLVVTSFSMVGDGLRDALDPRLKNK